MNSNVGAIEYDARILTKNLKADSAKADAIARQTGDNIGSNIEKGEGRATKALSRMVKFAKYALVGTAAAVSAAIGKFVIGGGISRALNIEDAQAKLKGLGHDTKSVTKIMESALKSVKGTAFGLDAAATAAASAVAAGVKPGKELTRVLAITGDTATITGRSFSEAGAIINKVLAGNRLSMEEVNQLQDAGLPILQMLSKQYGVSAIKLREMVSKGKVDSKDFLKAIEKNIGGAALASGNTTRGAWENMKAAMSRVGADIVKNIIPRVRDAFGSMTKWFDDNSAEIVNNAGKVIEILKTLGGGLLNVGKVILPIIQTALKFKDALVALAISLIGLRVINSVQNALNTFGMGLTVSTIKTLGFKDSLGVLVGSINPVTAALMAATAVYTIISSVINKATDNLIAMMEAQAKAADEAAQAAGKQYQSAIQAYKDLANAAEQYLSITKQLTSAEGAVKVARQKLADVTRQFGSNSKQAKNATAELSEASARLKQLDVDRKVELDKLIASTLEATKSGGALTNTSKAQIAADLAHAIAIRDTARARGEDTKKIDGVINSLKGLIKIKDQTIKTDVQPGQTHAKLQKIKDSILGVPKSKTIQFITDASKFRVPNILTEWKGVPFKLPGNAMGTNFWKGGPTVVGEKGPEIVNLPRGSQVIPNHEIDKSMGSSIENNIGTINIAKEVDADRLIRRLTQEQEIISKGLVPRTAYS